MGGGGEWRKGGARGGAGWGGWLARTENVSRQNAPAFTAGGPATILHRGKNLHSGNRFLLLTVTGCTCAIHACKNLASIVNRDLNSFANDTKNRIFSGNWAARESVAKNLHRRENEI